LESSMGLGHRLAAGLAVMLFAVACNVQPQVPVAAKPSPTAAATSAEPGAGHRCNALTVAASRHSPITAGDRVSITARAGGCDSPDYRFVLLDQTGGTTVMQDWAPDAGWTWNSGSTLTGQVAVRADARAHGGTGYVPDVSAYLQFLVRGTPAAAVQTCRLPVSGIQPGSGGFVQMPAGTFNADPASDVPLRGQPDISRLRRGYTYDPVHGRWLPVPRDWVMPDFSSYVYVGTEYPHVSNQPALHVVMLPSGTDSLWPQGDQLYGLPIALRPEGVYGAPGPEIITMIDPAGAVATVDQGHAGLFAVVTPTAIWAARWSTTKGGTYVLTDVQRIDPKTQAATTWFHLDGMTAVPIGVDGSGSPIIAAGTQLPNGQISASQVWIVPQASVVAQGRLVYSDKYHPLVIQGPPIVSAGAIWIETDQGLWVDDNTTSSMHLVSSFSGYIAGGCL
jgi:hypothetical protein